MQKITFLGDIMCEPRLLRASKTKDGTFDFTNTFVHIRKMLTNSDYVIGNLETPLAGVDLHYVHSLFSFNAPDQFALDAKMNGIDMMLTANNHCLDRGLAGLVRTVQALDKAGIAHAGTFAAKKDRGNSYFTVGDTRYAVVSYTYGTNYPDNRIMLDDGQKQLVNLLRPQNERYFKCDPSAKKKSLPQKVWLKFLRLFSEEHRFYIKKFLGQTVNQAHADDNLMENTAAPYMEMLVKDIYEAKKQADVVLFCPHIGGQFNKIPGDFSRYVFDIACKAGVNAIIASHAHVVQEGVIQDGIPCFYSLGNFSMSPNSVYLLHENLPDYGIAAHLYVEKGKVVKTTFSILKIVENKKLSVFPVDEYYWMITDATECKTVEKQVKQIYATVTGCDLKDELIRNEYLLS